MHVLIKGDVMTKKEKLIEEYNKLKEDNIISIHMFLKVHGTDETIISTSVGQKIDFIKDTYDDDLKKNFDKEIEILDVTFMINGILSFGEALGHLEWGKGIRLKSWNKETVIKLQIPDCNSKMTANYLYVDSLKGRVPWIPNMIEILSDEWEVVAIV